MNSGKRSTSGIDTTTGRIAVAVALVTVATLVAGTRVGAPPPDPAGVGEVVPGELIVRFQAGVGADAQADALRPHGARVERPLPLPRTKVVRIPPSASVRAVAAALERSPAVEYAEPNFVRTVGARIPNDPRFAELWGLASPTDRDIDALEAWDMTTGSDGVVVVAVVDSGVQYTHPDLAANIRVNAEEIPGNGIDDERNGFVDDVHGWDFVAGDNTPLDENGHGTHVAGTIGARGNNGLGVVGVNWTVKLLPLRVGDASGSMNDVAVVRAFDYAGRSGVRVVNGSFGGPGNSKSFQAAIEAYPNTLFVFAAGNGGSDGVGDNNDAGSAAAQYPCDYASANVICVAASTETSDALAPFSNFGATSVDLAAPGTSILSTVPGGSYGRSQGTSMATPHVAGAAALVLAANSGLSAVQVRSTLLANVDPVLALTGKVATGGRLDAFRAVRSAAPPPPPSPPPPADVAPPPSPPPAPPPPIIDRTPPDTRITRGPARSTTARRATFRFVATEAGSTFRCRLDGRRWRSCRSPRTYLRLARGLHTFRVRAIDRAGNVDATPAKRTWRIR